MKTCVVDVPLGISLALDAEDIQKLRHVFGAFALIEFNVARSSERAYTLQVIRRGVPSTRTFRTVDDTVGGLLRDNLRLSEGVSVEFIELAGSRLRLQFWSA